MNMKALMGMLDVFPGAKTYMTFVAAFGMLICQGLGYHMFTATDWGMVSVAGLTFWKMGKERVPTRRK